MAALLLLVPGAVTAQHRMVAPSGRELSFPEDALREMLDTTRALRHDLEEDPRILYFIGTGPVVPAGDPEAAFPWNAVEVLADSLAAIQTPGSLREAERAYANYAVIRMKNVRRDPDVSCDSLMAREVRAVSSFTDGWIVARVLFGGPSFVPLDEVAFARQDGMLPGLLAERGNRQLGGCLRVWVEAHPGALREYREWRSGAFLETGGRRSAGELLPRDGAFPPEEQSGPTALMRGRGSTGGARRSAMRSADLTTPTSIPGTWVSVSTTR